jgi:hypothetical protein
MVTGKSGKKKPVEQPQGGSLWRKPIALDAFEEDDPLETLYRGREVAVSGGSPEPAVMPGDAEKTRKTPRNTVSGGGGAATEKPVARELEKIIDMTAPKSTAAENPSVNKTPARAPRLTEEELKNILKIKTDSFRFTDIREILRGKSFDIYAYLRFLCAGEGVCKIKHHDLMRKLDISRPTLFKQAQWLTRLSLIERRNVPGDHLGTTYIVHRLEEALPVPEALVVQIEARIAEVAQDEDKSAF